MNKDRAWLAAEEFLPSIVSHMADVYEENAVDGLISEDVLEEIADLFRYLPLPIRHMGFNNFLEELKNRGIKTDLKLYKGDA